MSLFVVDKEKCKRCGTCTAVCPVEIIGIDEGGSPPFPIDGAERMCINCGHCVAVCPHAALSHRAMTPEQCPPVRKEWLLGPEQAEHFLRYRRSIRRYKDKAVERDVLTKLIDVARFGPSGHNAQAISWLVVHDSDEVHRMAGQVIDWMRYMVEKDHPMAGVLHLDAIVGAWEMGKDAVCRNAPHLVIAYGQKEGGVAQIDCAIALTYLDLAAPSFGLGCCWAGFFDIAAKLWPPLQESLGLPEGQINYGSMMVGYPKYKYHRLPLRKEARIEWR